MISPIRIYCHTEKYEHIFDMERLRKLDSYCENDLKMLKKAIEEVQAHRLKLFKHAQQVHNMKFEKVVVITRNSADKIKYEVKLEFRPIVEKTYINNEKVYIGYKEHKIFAGKERKLALKYGEELAIENYCLIETKGFKVK
ncbi:hypothetical protein [Bacillus cereus]|uniref:Uncharacterized protein n=1 Tax=Bacillus cereus (strain VD146) TaxID=1053236 RepID=R8MDX8_BACCX|nr:hypothetical protein [Bacillus cereus]EOP32312.1 hypothetical protein IK1_05848 [Bacillus cereus VD146]